MAAKPSIETFLTEHEVAKWLRVSVGTVRRWRYLKKGPKYIKIGSAVRYTVADVRSFLDARPSGGGDQGNGQ